MLSTHPALSVRRQCVLLDLTRSSVYYKAHPRSPDTFLANEIHTLWLLCPFYGYRKIHAQLVRDGHLVNSKRVLRLMQEMGLWGMLPGPKTSVSRKKDPKWPNLLKGLCLERVDQVWATDITYLRIPKGFVYLVALIDVYSRYIVAYQVSVTLEAEFCIVMTQRSLLVSKPEIFHSDQGSQFTCEEMGQILAEEQIQGSMTGVGRCMDNIYIERFWESVKYEDFRFKDYGSVQEARACIDEYVRFYNERRLHQHLHYQTPKEVYTQTNKTKVEPFIYQERTKKKEMN